MDAYAGGRAYIDTALIQHMAEIDPSFEERKSRAYYVNLPRKIARLISNFLLSAAPQRDGADTTLTDDWTRDGRSVDDVMLQVSTMLNCYGLAWVLVDMPKVAGAIDLETKQRQRIRPFERTSDGDPLAKFPPSARLHSSSVARRNGKRRRAPQSKASLRAAGGLCPWDFAAIHCPSPAPKPNAKQAIWSGQKAGYPARRHPLWTAALCAAFPFRPKRLRSVAFPDEHRPRKPIAKPSLADGRRPVLRPRRRHPPEPCGRRAPGTECSQCGSPARRRDSWPRAGRRGTQPNRSA